MTVCDSITRVLDPESSSLDLKLFYLLEYADNIIIAFLEKALQSQVLKQARKHVPNLHIFFLG